MDRLDRVGDSRGPVVAVAPHSSEAQRGAAGVAAGRLHTVERDLHHQFRTHVHGDPVAADLASQELLGLPLQRGVGEALERLADHDEGAVRTASAQVQIREPAAPPAMAPLGGEHDEVERARALHLEPGGAAPPRFVRRLQRFGHHALVPGGEGALVEALRFVRVRGDDRGRYDLGR